jgi:hypothetical protein
MAPHEPLPRLARALDRQRLSGLSRSVRRRVERRDALDAHINTYLSHLDSVLVGNVGASSSSGSPKIRNLSSSPSNMGQYLRGIREDLSRHRVLEGSHDGDDAAAFGVLTAKSHNTYGERPDIARHGDAPIGRPPRGNVPIPLSPFMEGVEKDLVEDGADRLIRTEYDQAEIDQIRPYWDPELAKRGDVYHQEIDELLWSGMFELSSEEMQEEASIFYVWKTDGLSLRSLVDCRKGNARLSPPPSTDLAGGGSLTDVWGGRRRTLG